VVQLSSSVGEMDVNDAVSALGPEAQKEDVTLSIFSSRCFLSAFGWTRSPFLCNATRANQGLITDRGGSEGFSS
jgi:hypothetical protein